MTSIVTTRYVCDFCQKDIETTGSSYGPLVIQLTAPTFWDGVAKGDFCSPECACKWLNGPALTKLSG